MGLAIPRPTRLGDPRPNGTRWYWNILMVGESDDWPNCAIVVQRLEVIGLLIKKIIKWAGLFILSLNLRESNDVFRRAIIRTFFEPELIKMDYHKSSAKHPLIKDDGLAVENVLHLFFDVVTGNDYPDGDEWFSVEYLIPHNLKLPDSLKGPDYFTTITLSEGKYFWRHRELIRFKYGKSKKLTEALEFINKRYRELINALEDSSVANHLK
jgi:hypothetical protein